MSLKGGMGRGILVPGTNDTSVTPPIHSSDQGLMSVALTHHEGAGCYLAPTALCTVGYSLTGSLLPGTSERCLPRSFSPDIPVCG